MEEKNKNNNVDENLKLHEEENYNENLLETSSLSDKINEEMDKQEDSEYPYIQQDLSLQSFKDLINKKDAKELRQLMTEVPISLLAEYLADMDDTQIVLFFKMSRTDEAAELFSYLDNDQQRKVIEAFSNKEIQELVSQMSTDDLVDFVDELPSNLVDKVLQSTSKQNRDKINAFLAFKDGTAGSIMTTEYVHLKRDMTVKDSLDKIRRVGKLAETISRLFVLDNSRILIGIVSLEDIIFAQPNEKIEDIMKTDYAFAFTQTDQEEVSELFKKYDLTVLPVTNSEKRMLGIITVDDILDVVEEETTEDMNKMSGIAQKTIKPYFQTSIWKTTLSCFPWLIILLVVGTFTSLILDKYQDVVLISLPVLSVFIPTLMDTGGNSGSQATTVITRALSLKEIQPKQWWKVIIKEVLSGMMIGLIIGLFSFGWVMLETSIKIVDISDRNFGHLTLTQAQLVLSMIVGLCIFIVVVLSRFFGAILPLLAKLIRLDPAVMAGPLITTILDCSALIIYFSLAQAILLPLVN